MSNSPRQCFAWLPDLLSKEGKKVVLHPTIDAFTD